MDSIRGLEAFTRLGMDRSWPETELVKRSVWSEKALVTAQLHKRAQVLYQQQGRVFVILKLRPMIDPKALTVAIVVVIVVLVPFNEIDAGFETLARSSSIHTDA